VCDRKNPITGERPYRRFKGKYGEDDEGEGSSDGNGSHIGDSEGVLE